MTSTIRERRQPVANYRKAQGRSPPGCFRDERSPLATALTDNLLGALATTEKTETLPQQVTFWALSG